MRALPLNALRAFAAVYETGGIRPAARALDVTHSAVSRYVRELEAWVHAPLFKRREGVRSVEFTPQGEALGRAALGSLTELADAVAGVRELRSGNAVTVSTTPSFAARWLLPRLGALADAHPSIELSVVAEQALIDPAAHGVDLAIRLGHGPWTGFDCSPLMDDTLFPVMSPAAWDDAGRPSTPEALRRLRLLHDRDPNAGWPIWLDRFGPPGLDARSGPRYSSTDLLLRAAAQGLGVALARGGLATDDLASGTLIRPFGDRTVVVADAYWILRLPHAAERAAVNTVIDWLRAEVAADG